jgi:arabinofuranosyltransferase
MKIGNVSIREDHVILIGLITLFMVIALRSTWLCDDAYITFRTVDNLAHGLGPVWNTDERVQGFTNPLWMFILTMFYYFSGEIFFTSHLLQIAFSFATVVIAAYKLSITKYHAALAISAFILSKSFVDFSSSGLENALIHLTLVLFFVVYFESRITRRLLYLCLLASAGILTRMDTALLVLPPIGYVLVTTFRETGRTACRKNAIPVILGFLPFVLWEMFSLFYYGFLFPNTAYSKLGTQIPLGEYVEQGFYYLLNSLRLDPLTLTIICVAIVLAVVERKPKHMTAAGGVVLYLAYVVRIGGDFLSGRFLSACFLVSVIILSRIEMKREKVYFVSLFVLYIMVSTIALFPTMNSEGIDKKGMIKDSKGIADGIRTGSRQAGLLRTSLKNPLPQHDWVKRGRDFKRKNAKFPVLGGVGYTGFYSGPKVHIIDIYGLTEPLLARLPAGKPVHGKHWRIGHFRRKLPDGYELTLKSKKNVIKDKNLAEYYNKLRLITRGGLLSSERLWTIIQMNLGMYDNLLDAYVAANPDLWIYPDR